MAIDDVVVRDAESLSDASFIFPRLCQTTHRRFSASLFYSLEEKNFVFRSPRVLFCSCQVHLGLNLIYRPPYERRCEARTRMVSLWGSKKSEPSSRDEQEGDVEQQQQGGEEPPRSSHGSDRTARRYQEPDERTRLLPPPQGGYLSPDDPAVCTTTFE